MKSLFAYLESKVPINVKWIQPKLDGAFGEQQELKVASKKLSLDYEKLLNSFLNNGRLVDMTDDLWTKLQNTDSYKIQNISEAKDLAKKYKKNFDFVIERIENERTLQSPIVLVIPNGDPYLVAGNTRLAVCKALNINPKIYVVEYK